MLIYCYKLILILSLSLCYRVVDLISQRLFLRLLQQKSIRLALVIEPCLAALRGPGGPKFAEGKFDYDGQEKAKDDADYYSGDGDDVGIDDR